MSQFQIWVEGWCASGGYGHAQFLGEFDGLDFCEACKKWAASLSEDDRKLVDTDRLTYWACRLFDNEADARQGFG